jgi:hypothetical protein
MNETIQLREPWYFGIEPGHVRAGFGCCDIPVVKGRSYNEALMEQGHHLNQIIMHLPGCFCSHTAEIIAGLAG